MLRRELAAAGVTDDELARARRQGLVRRVRRGAYLAAETDPARVPDRVALHRLAVRAAVRTVSADAVVSHGSAAALHGIGLWRVPLDRVEMTRSRRSGARAGRELRLHAAPLDPDEITVVDGIAVTSVARTVVDVARSVPFAPAVAVADAAMFAGLVTPDELGDAVARSARRPGNPAARRVLAAADGRADGPGETRSRLLLRTVGLPAPDLQHPVRDRAGLVLGWVDFWWERERVAGEFDGRSKYGRLLRPGQEPGDAVFAEKVREDAIRAEDVTVVRWIWRDLTSPATFAGTADRLFRALASRRTRGTEIRR
jgi:hypothetical protein